MADVARYKSKVVRKDGKEASDLEQQVATALDDIETNPKHPNPTLQSGIKGLTFASAKEVNVSADKTAVVILVPPPLLEKYKKVHSALIDELEKKLSRTVVIIGNRTMVPPTTWKRSKEHTGVRPRSRSLKAVQEAMLDDIVYPTDIAGKRIRVKADGSRLLKVRLNPKDAAKYVEKTEAFRAIYKALTSKEVSFTEF